jgi:hypothetical protein
MASDYTVITHQSVHIGDEPGAFGQATFAGRTFRTQFSCPNVDSSQRAVLVFQSRGIQSAHNTIAINGSRVFGGVPVSQPSTGPETQIWNGNVALVEAGALRSNQPNELVVEARPLGGGPSGNIDDILIDNMVIFFKTR